MGKINTYRRKQLASSVVGTARTDTSGQIIGKAVVGFAGALAARQDALDTAAVSTAYYQYSAALSLKAAGLQQEYQSNSNIDPLSYDVEFQGRADKLSTTMKKEMPSRLHGKFDVLVSKGKAVQSIKNNKWVFDQQNRNSLSDFNELNTQASILAGNAMNAEDFLIGRDGPEGYLATAEQYRPLLTPNSFNTATKRALKQRAVTYWANSIDFRNGANPGTFSEDLRTNEKLKATLIEDLGSKDFNKLEEGLAKVLKDFGADSTFLKLTSDNKELSDKVDKVWNPSNDYGLKQVTMELETEINKRNYIANINKDGEHDGIIEQYDANIANLHTLQKIATNVNDVSYVSDPRVEAEILAEINMIMAPLGKDKFKTELAKAKQDIGNKLARQDIKIPWHHYLLAPLAARELVRGGIERSTGIPAGIRQEQKENIKASKTASQYIEATQTMKGRVLQAVDDKQLTFKTAMNYMGKLKMLSTLEQYDSLTTQGDNWYSAGYKDFSDYARGMNLLQGSSVENNRQFRDDIRTQMMDSYSKKIAFLESTGTPITANAIASAIGQVKREKNLQIHPEVMGLKKGDPYISPITGTAMEFGGFNPQTGEVISEDKNLNKALGNL